jgi:hypothetical protein
MCACVSVINVQTGASTVTADRQTDRQQTDRCQFTVTADRQVSVYSHSRQIDRQTDRQVPVYSHSGLTADAV